MDTLVYFVFVAFPLLIIAESITIENCNDDNYIAIQRNANNTIVCKGFNQSHTIEWSIQREQKTQLVATCYPNSHCTVRQPDLYAVERSPTQSRLFYQQYDLDIASMVFCESNLADTKRTASCALDVINPAELSNCTVEQDKDRGTVRGRCRFEHAYSFGRTFLCYWYEEKDEKPKTFSGNIMYDNGSPGPSGWCTFTDTDTTREPGLYTYSIDFYPGPGKLTVNVGNIYTNSQTSTRGTAPDTSSKTQKEVEQNDLPVGAIVGGIVAVVAVIIIIVVVVVVVVIRRKRRQRPAGSAKGSSNDASHENDDFEEHVNPMYVTSQDQDDTHTTDHKPSAIALRISPNSHNGHPAGPQLEADMYSTVDGEARHVPSYQASGMGGRSGGYEDIGFGSNGNKRAPQKDEYAVVDKSRAQKGPASSANTRASSPAHTTEGSDEYAVVDKSSSRNKAAKNVASGLSDAATNEAGADVYAQVNKPAKKVKVAEPETEGAAYAQVQKSKPVVKPKTSAKPSSDKDVRHRSAADDDEYHTLSHTRGSPHSQDQADLESQYSHIGHD